MSGMKVNRNTMKPFNSAINSGNGAFERSMRKLNVIKRNISSTVSQDQITQVDSNFSSGANEKSGDADFDQIDFTTAQTLVNQMEGSSLLDSLRKDTPPKLNLSRPSEQMYKRWQKALSEAIPAIDMQDASPCGPGMDNYTKRQFAPEYSQAAYETMLSQEYAIGSYISTHGQTLSITAAQRKRMVILIEDLHRHKGYKIDTLFLAVSIADRYLVNMAVEGQKAPCLVTLGVTCLLMAAKLEQPMHPSFNIMIRLLADTQRLFVTK